MTAAWSGLKDRNSAKRKTSIHHNGAPAILTPASRDNCVLPPNTLFSDKYRQSIDKYRQLCGAAKYSVFRLTRSRFNVATPTSSFLSSIIAFLIHQIKTVDKRRNCKSNVKIAVKKKAAPHFKLSKKSAGQWTYYLRVKFAVYFCVFAPQAILDACSKLGM